MNVELDASVWPNVFKGASPPVLFSFTSRPPFHPAHASSHPVRVYAYIYTLPSHILDADANVLT